MIPMSYFEYFREQIEEKASSHSLVVFIFTIRG